MRRLLLMLSVSGNLLLIYLLVTTPNSAPEQSGSPPSITPASVVPALRGLERPGEPSAASWTPPPQLADRFRPWLAALREAGYPDEIVNVLMAGRLAREHRRALQKALEDFVRSWDVRFQPGVTEFDTMVQFANAHRDALRQDLEEILGIPAERVYGELFHRAEAAPISALSVDERREVRRIESLFRQELNDLNRRAFRRFLTEDERLQRWNRTRELKAALRAALSPESFEAYWYRVSPAAEYARTHLPPARNEEEFRQLVEVVEEQPIPEENVFARQHLRSPEDAEDARQIGELKEVLQRRVESIVGADRLAALAREETERRQRTEEEAERRRQEQEAKHFLRAAASVGIETEAARRVLERFKAAESTWEAEFNEMARTLTGTPAERDAALKRIVWQSFEALAAEVVGNKAPAFVEELLQEK